MAGLIQTVAPNQLGAAGVTIIGTRILAVRHKNPGGAGVITVKPSTELPYPGVVTQIKFFQNSVGPDSIIQSQSLFLAADNSLSTSPITGTPLAIYSRVGASPPDIATDTDDPFSNPFAGAFETFDVWIPVPKNGYFIKTVSRAVTATGGQAWWYFTVLQLSRPITDPTELIIPRGSQEPAPCIPVCPPTAPPTAPPPPGAPPPPAPPPPTPGVVDVLQEPLPPASDVEPTAPLGVTSRLCTGTA